MIGVVVPAVCLVAALLGSWFVPRHMFRRWLDARAHEQWIERIRESDDAGAVFALLLLAAALAATVAAVLVDAPWWAVLFVAGLVVLALGLYARAQDVRRCRVCGCTERRACVDSRGRTCGWVGPDLCSRCAL